MTILDFRNKLILAPMVRTGTLPMRLLAYKYGADIVFSPEVIDKAIHRAKRVENYITGTIDYLNEHGKIVFQTKPCERNRLVFQMGSADENIALEAAKIVDRDVSAFDLNCGCPKWFSIQGGMGAALLDNSEKLCKILKTLVENTEKQVTCKIRINKDFQKTINLVKQIESTGVSAITVHTRTPSDKPTDPADWNCLSAIVNSVSIPVIANGDIFSLEDAEKIKQQTGCASVMMARAAQANPSVFRKEGLLPLYEVTREYVKNSIDVDNIFHNTKYVTLQMWPLRKDSIHLNIAQTKTMKDIAKAFDLLEYYESVVKDRETRGAEYEKFNTQKRHDYSEELPYIPREEYLPDSVKNKIRLGSN
ncbi:FMN-linked oxidoreductase [Rozella allomycis CSF55]|uniref:Aldolase-type TIM barrel domain-containing protein n=1 Tax=Rozella allomycis (strain CSF55) TaxID=988480 RepID=A0A075B442_ROZAC|nr:Aldolase-type TIM barrel domain-containing protein [Rozella allomycis CSF55]RKP21051.1 FMN-linked oxidoreductase [Rozella allomycis CSF55]|eukprot:EPZ35849.1 Aldolase-type TIM barrel domain-containing protein [Rozella allomycis CSF55]